MEQMVENLEDIVFSLNRVSREIYNKYRSKIINLSDEKEFRNFVNECIISEYPGFSNKRREKCIDIIDLLSMNERDFDRKEISA